LSKNESNKKRIVVTVTEEEHKIFKDNCKIRNAKTAQFIAYRALEKEGLFTKPEALK